MSDLTHDVPPEEKSPPRWQPISSIERRVLGVLAEKAKTTPDAYPMSLNAITTGCNQKSNRFPVMQVEPDQVEEALDSLRGLGAVGMIEGYGRVAKYRHYLYEWLGVEKVELAVMTELLLRGAQTEGELRGRAARMEPIADLAALRPILDSLRAKKLVISLTPEGRGHVVSHNLYKDRELENLRSQYASWRPAGAPGVDEGEGLVSGIAALQVAAGVAPPAAQTTPSSSLVDDLQREIGDLRSSLAELQHAFEQLSQRHQQTENEVRRLRDALGG